MGLVDDIEYALSSELTRRMLVKYFAEKGYEENFDLRVYPPALQDIQESIPELSGKIELVPHAIEIDPTTGFARLGWNLFVLGNQRMYLGETEHTDLKDLAKQMDGKYVVTENQGPARQMRTARDIVNWATRVLGNTKAGIIRLIDQEPHQASDKPIIAGTQSGGFYERPKTIRPEMTSQNF